jgi:hypothetical protein
MTTAFHIHISGASNVGLSDDSAFAWVALDAQGQIVGQASGDYPLADLLDWDDDDLGDFPPPTIGHFTQADADYAALFFALEEAPVPDDDVPLALTIHTDSTLVVKTAQSDAAPPGLIWSDWWAQARARLRSMQATIVPISPDANQAAPLAQAALQRNVDANTATAQARIRRLRAWMSLWEDTIRSEMLDITRRLHRHGLFAERSYLERAFAGRVDALLHDVEPLIQAYEDTLPLVLGGPAPDVATTLAALPPDERREQALPHLRRLLHDPVVPQMALTRGILRLWTPSLNAAAWASYEQHGRGVFLLDGRELAEGQVAPSYVPLGHLRHSEAQAEVISEAVVAAELYDPLSEVLVLVLLPKAAEFFWMARDAAEGQAEA